MDLRQTPQYAKYVKSIGWTVERLHDTNYFIKKIPIIGSIVKVQRVGNVGFDDIKAISKKHRAFQIVVEPLSLHLSRQLTNNGYKLSKSPFLPTKTLQIDLKQTKEKLLSKMHAKTRYNINKSQKSMVTIQNSKDIKSFVDFWHKCNRKRLWFLSQRRQIISLFNAFDKKANLYFAQKDDRILAGLLTVTADKTSYYMYAASNQEGKKLFAPTALTWHAIIEAKSRGVRIFDFDGIYDERFPIKTWKGFTRFKKGFGGIEVEYPGCFIKHEIPIVGRLGI